MKLIYGNSSRKAKNWIAGPTHEVQDQHIPGYTGHVPGVVCENLFSKSYARCTASAISGNLPKNRFKSVNQKEFSPKNFRRIIEKPNISSKKDYEDYAQFVNDDMEPTKRQLLSKTPMQASQPSALSRFRDSGALPPSHARHTSDTRSITAAPSVRTSLLTGGSLSTKFQPQPIEKVKPVLLENKVSQDQQFFRLSDGFKNLFLDDKKDSKMSIPICGYAGHKRGDKSQNFFGKSFRDCAIQSKRLERHLIQH